MVIGIVFLNAADSPPGTVRAGAARTTTTLEPVETTSTLPPTTTIPQRAPKDIKVIALNGTSTKGVAGKVTDTLRRLGYNVLSPTDAKKAERTVLYVTAGYEREGAELARALELSPEAVQPLTSPGPVADLRGANLVVLVGPDLAAKFATTATTAKTTATTKPTTATTAKPTTTTTD